MSYVEKSHSDYSINTWAVTSLPFSSFAAVHIFPMLRPLFCLLFCSQQITMTSQTDVRAPVVTRQRCNHKPTNTGSVFFVSSETVTTECTVSTCTVDILIVFNGTQYYDSRQSQSWRRCMSCRGREQAFSTLDRVTEQRETNQTGWKVTLLLFRPFFFFCFLFFVFLN